MIDKFQKIKVKKNSDIRLKLSESSLHKKYVMNNKVQFSSNVWLVNLKISCGEYQVSFFLLRVIATEVLYSYTFFFETLVEINCFESSFYYNNTLPDYIVDL